MAETRFVTLLGWSGTGKTTLAVRLIAEFRRRGATCSAAKRARHPASVAPEGKDSSLFLEAGAMASAYVGDAGTAVFLPPGGAAEDAAFYASLLPPSEIIMLEGAEVDGSILVLLAGGADSEAALKRPLAGIDILVATDAGLREAARLEGKASFHPDDVSALVDHILEAAAWKTK